MHFLVRYQLDNHSMVVKLVLFIMKEVATTDNLLEFFNE